MTTSRKSSREAIEIAKVLSSLIPDSHFERRGTKSIDDVVKIARKKGHQRVVVVADDKSTISLHFISLDGMKWDWMPVTVEVSGFGCPADVPRVRFLDGDLWELFGFEPEDGGAVLKKTQNKLVFKQGRAKLLEMKVKFVEAGAGGKP